MKFCAVKIFTGDTRVAKVGKSIRVPAEMTYAEYKRVYVEKGAIKAESYRRFENAKEASKYFEGAVVSWSKKLSEEEKAAVTEYTGTHYRTINNYLRGRYADSDFKAAELQELKATIENLDSAIDKFVLADNMKF